MANTTAVEGLQFLTQSPVRVRILELLGDADGMEKRELRERIDVSRVTVRRNVRALEERGWIEIEDRVCSITVLGSLVLEDVSPALETTAVVERLRPFLRWFPEAELEFDARALADATIVTADSTDPYAPVNRHIEAVEEAGRFRGLFPVVGLQAMTVGRDRVVEDDCRHELVVSSLLEPTIRDRPEYRELVDEMLVSGNCDLFVADCEIPFYLGLFDAAVQVGVEDDEGVPQALVETDAEEIREWAERTYEAYLKRADPFDR